MTPQIESAVQVLESYRGRRSRSASEIDRAEVVAHATLSAWAHHWPSEAPDSVRSLLSETAEIKLQERSRWVVQRRLAIGKILAQSALTIPGNS